MRVEKRDERRRGALAVAVHREEPGALERLVALHQDRLFDYASRMVGRADGQEVVQDALVRAHRALTAQYDEARCAALPLRPWLLRIVRNLCLNRLRSGRADRTALVPLEAAAGDAAAARPPAAEARLLVAERHRALERALAALDEGGREAVTLRFLGELSYAEIAAVIGGTEAAARGRVFRALARLREILEDEEVSDAL